ncbi:MAG: glucose-6-phosphate isomerase, partial [Thermobifida fusca]|nr:glucose-6-phosphate isomerase [Thermobifida fusca]
GPDTHLVVYGETEPEVPETADTVVTGPLGAQFLAWEYATAVAGHLLGINPFDQPNVQESKDNTKALLELSNNGTLPTGTPLLTDGAVEVYASDGTGVGDAKNLASVLRALIEQIPDDGYLAVMAYLDRDAEGDGQAAALRSELAALTARPVTFGWGPRFLHSTGQYHKGGPANGVFLQITGDITEDLPIAGKPYTFSRLQLAQALGDFNALAERSRPTVRLHWRDRSAGLAELIRALGEIRP